jgi:hypothetical protein
VTVAARAAPADLRRLAAAGVEVVAPSAAVARERSGHATAVVRVDEAGRGRRALVRAVEEAGVPMPARRAPAVRRDAARTTR